MSAMSDFAEEIGDATEEIEELSEKLEEDIQEAFGVEFDVNLHNVSENHHRGTALTFQFSPDEEEFADALNEVSDGAYEDVEFQNAGSVHLHILKDDD